MFRLLGCLSNVSERADSESPSQSTRTSPVSSYESRKNEEASPTTSSSNPAVELHSLDGTSNNNNLHHRNSNNSRVEGRFKIVPRLLKITSGRQHSSEGRLVSSILKFFFWSAREENEEDLQSPWGLEMNELVDDVSKDKNVLSPINWLKVAIGISGKLEEEMSEDFDEEGNEGSVDTVEEVASMNGQRIIIEYYQDDNVNFMTSRD